MFDSKRTTAVMLAFMTVIGFAVAPMAAVASSEDGGALGQQVDEPIDDGNTSVQADHGPFPHEVCTDLLAMFNEEAPYDMIVWVDDLPQDMQPPGVPWSVITPQAVASIVVGATPNQCDIQDPNDPSFDPTEDDVDPDGNADAQQGEEGEVLFIVNGTLDQSSEGPSVAGEAGLELDENGSIDPNSELNDGEKKYGVDPGLQYWSDGTTYFETDVYVFGSRLGVEQDCFGEECTFTTRGLPNFVEYPALPSHTDRERPDDGSDSDDGDDSNDGESGTDDSDGESGPGSDSTGDDSADGDGSGDDADGGADGPNADGGDDGEGSADDGEADGGDDGADDSDGESGDTDSESGDTETATDDGGEENTGDDADQQQTADDGNDAQQAIAADGSGLGVIVALVVFILGAAAIAPRD